jgi:hypothetical protein
MLKEKSKGIYFKLSPKERELIEKRMAQTKIQNMSAYIRKMCMDGCIVNLDVSPFDEIGSLLRKTSNNINQIAKQANTNGEIERIDIAEVNEQLTQIRMAFGEALNRLSKI